MLMAALFARRWLPDPDERLPPDSAHFFIFSLWKPYPLGMVPGLQGAGRVAESSHKRGGGGGGGGGCGKRRE